MILDGKEIAAEIREELKLLCQSLGGRPPGLSVVLVGQDPASHAYVRMKRKACEMVGIKSEVIEMPEDVAETEVLALVDRLNEEEAVDGILVQLPLPDQVSTYKVLHRLDPKKDIDGFHPVNVGKLVLGESDGFVPCTPAGVVEMLARAQVEVAGKEVVIVGRSNIVGKPLAALLMQKHNHCNATVTVAHSRTENLEEVCKRADVLIAAMGRPGFIGPSFVKAGAVVIDVGISRQGEKLVGDVDFDAVRGKCSMITPVPGGVGPMTVAMLLKNTLKSRQCAG